LPVSVGLVVSLVLFGLGRHWSTKSSGEKITIPEGAWVVFWVWMLSCSISSLVFNLGGFPDPATAMNYDWFSRYINGFFEAMSGFTTSGTSILNNVELYSRSLLFRRSAQHWIGGMGIAFMAVTLWKYFTVDRSEVITAEAESPHRVVFDDQEIALQSGKDFLKIYIWMSAICVTLLILSGIFFREVAYPHWWDNIFDAIVHMFAAMGT
jgi:trk system potassium uptake protein